VPDFLYDEKFRKMDHDFRYFKPIFCCAYAETAIKLLPVKYLTQNLKPSWAVSYSTPNFWGTYYKIYACFERKTAFVMQNFGNLGPVGVGVTIFDEIPKRHILA